MSHQLATGNDDNNNKKRRRMTDYGTPPSLLEVESSPTTSSIVKESGSQVLSQSTSDSIRIMGGKETGMKLIPPPSTNDITTPINDQLALQVLIWMDDILQRRGIKSIIERHLKQEEQEQYQAAAAAAAASSTSATSPPLSSVRKIDGNRFELFIQTTGKATKTVDHIIRRYKTQLLDDLKNKNIVCSTKDSPTDLHEVFKEGVSKLRTTIRHNKRKKVQQLKTNVNEKSDNYVNNGIDFDGDEDEDDDELVAAVVRKILVEYAQNQARKDDRVYKVLITQENGRNDGSGDGDNGSHNGTTAILTPKFEFDNFSILVNFEPSDAQIIHVDVKRPNFQFGLPITSNTPGTLLYDVEDYCANDVENDATNDDSVDVVGTSMEREKGSDHDSPSSGHHSVFPIKTVKDVVNLWNDDSFWCVGKKQQQNQDQSFVMPESIIRLWNENARNGCSGDARSKLIRMMERNDNNEGLDNIRDLITSYGNALILRSCLTQERRKRARVEKSFRNCPTGSLLSLPGSVLHAGPRTDGFRAILFFSLAKHDQRYDPDEQFCNVRLCAHIISILLEEHKSELSSNDYRYLLHVLTRYVLDDVSQRISLFHGDMNEFLRKIERFITDKLFASKQSGDLSAHLSKIIGKEVRESGLAKQVTKS